MTRAKTKPTAVAPKPEAVPFATSAKASEDDVDLLLKSLPAAQRDRINGVIARSQSRGKGADMKLEFEKGVLQISFKHVNPEAAALMLMSDLGTMDPAFYSGVTGQIACIGAHGARIDETNSNFLLSVVRSGQPRDELETMLAVQMGAIHAGPVWAAHAFR